MQKAPFFIAKKPNFGYIECTVQDIFELKKEIEGWAARASALLQSFSIDSMRTEQQALAQTMQSPDFWSNPETAQGVARKNAVLERELAEYEQLQQTIAQLPELLTMVESDRSLQEELEKELVRAQDLLQRVELKTYFTDEHDDAPALVSFAAGAGGIDAMDWTERLMRMYIRFAELKEWKAEVLDISQGEEAGIKSATLRIEGRYAYGMLKGEAGVHRLVRISPFDSEGMRHTSFAAVEVIPELTDVSEDAIKIDPDDLRVDTFLSSGKGGQSVNTTYSAVRLTHIPTGTVVSCQNERSQQQNRDTAMSVLKSRLYQLLLTERKEKIEELRGVRRSIEWGSQIRSYVMQPYRLVKDHRTNVETSDIDAVLDGGLQPFIEGYLLDQAKK